MTDVLAPIRHKFRLRCAENLKAVRGVLAQPALANADFRSMIHQLVGMAGSVGFLDLSDQAAELDGLNAIGAALNLEKLAALEVVLAEVAVEGDAQA